MSSDILDHFLSELNKTTLPFDLQLVKSTDVAQCSQLLTFVRYATETGINVEFLFCRPLLATTKETDNIADN